MLTPEVPSDVHQFNCIQSATTHPRRAGAVRADSMKTVLRGHQTSADWAVGNSKVGANMGAEHHIDIFEQPSAHHVVSAGKEFLGNAGIQPQRASQIVFLHELLHSNSGSHIHRLAGIVPFSVARTPLNQRIVIGHAGFLRGLQQPSISAIKPMTGFPFPHEATQAVGMPATPR